MKSISKKAAPVLPIRATTTNIRWACFIESELESRGIVFETDDDTGTIRGLPAYEITAQTDFPTMSEVVQKALLCWCNYHYKIEAESFDDPLAYAALMEFRGNIGYLQKFMGGWAAAPRFSEAGA